MIKTDDSYNIYTSILILIFLIISTIYNAYLPIHVDEAYYWTMSQYPSLCYFDIPPLLSFAIAFFTIFGDAEWIIRLTSLVFLSGSAIYIYKLTSYIYTKRAGFWAVAIFLTLPVTNVGASIVTTDAPMTFFWFMALFHTYRAINEDKIYDYILAGVAIGLGLISKYTMVLFPVGVVLYLIFFDKLKLIDKKFWFSVLIAFILFLPVLVWNYQNEWAGLLFRYDFGSTKTYEFSLKYVVEYFVGAIFLFSPIFFFYFLSLLVRNRNSLKKSEKFILFIIGFFFFYFLYKSFFRPMAYNWYAPIALSAIVIISGYLDIKNSKKILFFGIGLSVILTLLIKTPELFNLPAKLNMKNRVAGYEEAIKHFSAHIPKDAIISGDYYSTASMLRYFLPEYKDRTYEPFTTRVSDFDFWTDKKEIEGKNIYLFTDRKPHKIVYKSCKDLSLIDSFTYKNKNLLDANFYLYFCKNYQ